MRQLEIDRQPRGRRVLFNQPNVTVARHIAHKVDTALLAAADLAEQRLVLFSNQNAVRLLVASERVTTIVCTSDTYLVLGAPQFECVDLRAQAERIAVNYSPLMNRRVDKEKNESDLVRNCAKTR